MRATKVFMNANFGKSAIALNLDFLILNEALHCSIYARNANCVETDGSEKTT
jgi:hypothetical protein